MVVLCVIILTIVAFGLGYVVASASINWETKEWK
jgi:hypothetical protein